MKIQIYHLDAFTDKLFSGNPAAVCLLENWLPDSYLHAIAQENNLPATAFLVKDSDKFLVRWITPEYELDLCGHGTLASGFVIFNYLQPSLNVVHLQSKHELLQVSRSDDFVTLNFPVKDFEPVTLPLLEAGLGLAPKEIYQHKEERCFAVYNSEEEVRQLTPTIEILKKLTHRGITVTAKGTEVDFVSRTFYPQKTISEDPATGASHCLLAPYWAKRLNKSKLRAKQVSKRGGAMLCELEGDRVLISGQVVLYKEGVILLSI